MRVRRFEVLLFGIAWFTYAYFHQGGGWNQNGRFALTRAVVESRQPWIDDYLVYASAAKGSPGLRRLVVRDGCFQAGGRVVALGWYARGGPLVPLSPNAPEGADVFPVETVACTGDLAFARGHVHPNKAPGASFAAVPGYALIYGLERATGIDPDDYRVLAINAWLTGVLSVGLVSALGVVAFWRLALRVSGRVHDKALFATIALAFGSLFFPYATMLYDHDLVAVALIAAFLFAWPREGVEASWQRPFAAGLCAGAAVLASYLSVIALTIVGVYLVYRSGRRALVAFAAGTAPPLALLAAYNVACFGRIVTTNYAWQNPLFKDAQGSFFDIFAMPDPGILAGLVVSPARGLIAITPVFVLGAIGLVPMIRSRRLRPEGVFCLAMVAHVFAFNVSFKAWHGGYACGPRYLIPALPFLALPIVMVTSRAAWIRHTLLAVSIVAMALVTTVDAQPPWIETVRPGAGSPSDVSPVWSIDLPQFLHARPGAYGSEAWRDTIRSRYVEPVSANPGGIAEAMPGRFFAPGTTQAAGNSFNVGEFVFPGSRLSVAPWLVLAGIFAYLMRRELGRHDQGAV